jgi:hypothetical protein
MSYTKLANSILTSTIWVEDDHTRIVWVTLLALADRNGEVEGSIPGLASIARVPVESCRAAITKFLAPDPDSRTATDEGRRVECIDGGWLLINHGKYRERATDDHRKSKAAERQQRARERNKRNSGMISNVVTPESRQIPQAEAEAEAYADSKSKAYTKAKKATARPLTARRNLNAEFEHPRFDVPTSWHLRHVKDISEGEAGMTAFYSWLSDRVDRTNEDTIVAGVEHGRFVWLDRCFAEWMLSTRKAPARLDTFAESQKRRQEELEANYDPRFEGLTMREKVELAKRLQAEEAEQVP